MINVREFREKLGEPKLINESNRIFIHYCPDGTICVAARTSEFRESTISKHYKPRTLKFYSYKYNYPKMHYSNVDYNRKYDRYTR